MRHRLTSNRESRLRKYAGFVIGEFSLPRLLKYEMITSLLGPIPGATGLFLRRMFYPFLFDDVGRDVVFGRNLVIRHPDRIRIGDRVFFDDDCLLDARGAGDLGLVIEDDVIIGRRASIQAKVGPIRIGRSCTVGSDSFIVSQGSVDIAELVTIGGGCKISGGMMRIPTDEGGPLVDRYSNGPVRIERRCVLAMGAMVLDNVTLGEGTFVGAGAVASMNVPPHSILSPRPPLVFRSPDAAPGDEP